MLLGWLFRILIAALLLRLAWRFFSGLVRGVSEPKTNKPDRSVALVRDPICGTFIEPSRSIAVSIGHKTHYFCSKSCRAKFHTKE